MNAVNKLILEYAKCFYHVDFVSENNMGESGNKIFEVQKNGTHIY